MKLVVGLGNPGKEYEKTRHNIGFGVVRKYVDFFKIPIDNILIISDDLDLPVGTYRLKPSGSSGGHNGLKDIEQNLGTKNYKRLKIGISNNKLIDTKNYVLGKFSKEELDTYQSLSSIVVNIINDYFTLEFSVLMNKYNHKNK